MPLPWQPDAGRLLTLLFILLLRTSVIHDTDYLWWPLRISGREREREGGPGQREPNRGAERGEPNRLPPRGGVMVGGKHEQTPGEIPGRKRKGEARGNPELLIVA